MKDKKEKITIKSIWKWLRSDKGKKYSFVVFYFFFFIFLFIVMSFPNNIENKDNNQTDIEETSLLFSTSNIEEDNINFNYLVKIDNDTNIYLVNKINKSIKVEYNNETYDYYYENGNLKPASDTDLDIFYQLLDVFEVKRILKSSKFVSKTEYSDGTFIYNYEIDNETLSGYLNTLVLDSSLKNSINIIVKNNKVFSMKFDLKNLINSSNVLTKQVSLYEINLNYVDIDE